VERIVLLTEEIRTLKLKNKLGLHARSAAAIVRVVQQFESKIYIEHKGQTVEGDSILDILTLACPYGGLLTIKAEGHDASAVMAELEKLVENKFGEA
jgi:phosphocarrier protein HPr